MKILVTGATGFIGNHVILELLKNNYEVIATSTSIGKAKKYKWFDRVQYIRVNMNEHYENVNLVKYFNYPDTVIHLAWEGLPNYKSLFHFEQNLLIQYSFIKNLIRNGISDITITGTCLEYGMCGGCLDETLMPMPSNPYAIAKNTLRLFLAELQKHDPFILKWVRLFYTFGEGQGINSLVSQLNKALENGDTVFNMSGGEQERDYLPVETVARNIVKIAMQQKVTGVINCCSGNHITVKNFVERYLFERGKTIGLNLGYYPYTDYEPMSFWGDNTKLKSIIGNE